MNLRARPTLVATSLAATLLLAACGGGDDGGGDTAAAPSSGDTVTAEPSEASSETRCASFDTDCVENLPENTVEARGILFRPDELTVDAGTTVTWVNMDDVDHTVTAGDKDAPMPDDFDLELAEQGSEATFTFDEPGTYAYFCVIHPSTMTGTVVVE